MTTRSKPATRAQTRIAPSARKASLRGNVAACQVNDAQNPLPKTNPASKGTSKLEKKTHMKESKTNGRTSALGGNEAAKGNGYEVLELSSDDESLPDVSTLFSKGVKGCTTGDEKNLAVDVDVDVIDIETDEEDGNEGEDGKIKLIDRAEGVEEIEVEVEGGDNSRTKKRRIQLERKGAMMSATRDAFYTLAGWQNLGDALPAQRDQHGQPSFWTTDGHEKKATPVWDLGFDRNWDEWGSAFMDIYRCQVKKSKPLHDKHLLKASRQTVRRHLKEGLWTTCNLVLSETSTGVTGTNWREPQLPQDTSCVASFAVSASTPYFPQKQESMNEHALPQDIDNTRVKQAISTPLIRVSQGMKRKVRG